MRIDCKIKVETRRPANKTSSDVDERCEGNIVMKLKSDQIVEEFNSTLYDILVDKPNRCGWNGR